MKKILVALAIAAFASTSFAKVQGTPHDFNASDTYTMNLASRCQYCHVPHAAQTWANVALWATGQALNAASFEYYSNKSYKVTSVDVAKSQTCLACHADGTTATTGLKTDLVGVKNVEYNLKNDHPIGNLVPIGANTKASLRPIILIGRSSYDATHTATVECGTCHSVHGPSYYTIQTRKLLYGPGNSNDPLGHASTTDFCGICHDR